jgi:uncharacterized protein
MTQGGHRFVDDIGCYNSDLHSPSEAPLLFLAAVAGGLVNSVAGGGGFICFPALLFTGMPPINANATNTVALWPGTVAATGAYRRELSEQNPRLIWPLLVMSIVGGTAGALLLLRTSQTTFMRMVPWLMLGATLLLAFGGRVTAAVRERHRGTVAAPPAFPFGIAVLQLAVAVYIGYFGAGAGIVILALLAVMGMENIHAMNGIKTLLASSANGVAIITFVIARTIVWPQALLMLVGAIVGGYAGAWYAQKMNPKIVRGFAITTGAVMTGYFFWKV